MDKFYKIYDNILPLPLEDSIYNKVFVDRNLDWRYNGNIAGHQAKQTFPGITHVFTDNNYSKESTDYFNHYLHSLCARIDMQVFNIIAGRLFMNFPLIGGDKKKFLHVDDCQQHWVAIYYINDVDGDTILYKDDEKTELCRISPKKGRIVLFDGTIPHTGSYPTLDSRAIINFNFLGEFYGK